jgi:hypothetical protein
MQAKLAPYQQTIPLVAATPAAGPLSGGPVLPGGLAAAASREKEYTALETSKIQAACSLTDAQWLTELPELYP